MRIETDDTEASVWLRAMSSRRVVLMHFIERKRHRELSMEGVFGVSEKFKKTLSNYQEGAYGTKITFCVFPF